VYKLIRFFSFEGGILELWGGPQKAAIL